MNIISYKYVLIIIFCFISGRSFAEDFTEYNSIEISRHFKRQNLQGHIKVFKSKSKTNPTYFIKQHKDSALKALKNNDMSYGFSQDYFWIYFSVTNSMDVSKKLFLQLANPHIDSTYLYELQEDIDSAILLGKGGDRMPFNERTIANRQFIFPINIQPHTTTHYALMVNKRNASVSYPLTLWDSKEFESHEKINNLLYMLYFGGILFVFVFSLVIGLIMKNLRLLSYSIYSGLMGFYLFIGLGFAFQYLYPWSDSLNNYIRTQIVILMVISFVVFTISFLKIKNTHLPSYRIFLGILVLLSSLFLLSIFFRNFAFTNIVLLLKFFYFLVFAILPITILSIIKSFKKHKSLSITYIIAMSALFAGAIIFNLIEFGILEESNFPINPILIGSIIELFIFSTAFIIEIKRINDKKNSLLKASAEQQKNLLKAYIEGTEYEDNRISQELHDNIGSRLALIRNQLKNSDTKNEIIEKDIAKIFSEVRSISNKLSPNSLHILGFVPSIQQLLNKFESSSNIKVNFYITENINLSETKSLQIFRVIQESIQNIIKHSKATQVDFQILKENEKIIITIDDNGVGFDMETYEAKAGKGLINMKLRVESVNGKIELSSQKDNGTHIVIWV